MQILTVPYDPGNLAAINPKKIHSKKIYSVDFCASRHSILKWTFGDIFAKSKCYLERLSNNLSSTSITFNKQLTLTTSSVRRRRQEKSPIQKVGLFLPHPWWVPARSEICAIFTTPPCPVRRADLATKPAVWHLSMWYLASSTVLCTIHAKQIQLRALWAVAVRKCALIRRGFGFSTDH